MKVGRMEGRDDMSTSLHTRISILRLVSVCPTSEKDRCTDIHTKRQQVLTTSNLVDGRESTHGSRNAEWCRTGRLWSVHSEVGYSECKIKIHPLCTLYSLLCILCTLYSLYFVLCALYSILCILSLLCTLYFYSARDPFPSAWYRCSFHG